MQMAQAVLQDAPNQPMHIPHKGATMSAPGDTPLIVTAPLPPVYLTESALHVVPDMDMPPPESGDDDTFHDWSSDTTEIVPSRLPTITVEGQAFDSQVALTTASAETFQSMAPGFDEQACGSQLALTAAPGAEGQACGSQPQWAPRLHAIEAGPPSVGLLPISAAGPISIAAPGADVGADASGAFAAEEQEPVGTDASWVQPSVGTDASWSLPEDPFGHDAGEELFEELVDEPQCPAAPFPWPAQPWPAR